MRAQSSKNKASFQSRGLARKEQPVMAWAALLSPKLMMLCFLLGCVLVSGLSVIYVTFQNRTYLNELQQLKNERNALQVQWGQLRIEQSTFSLEGRIERKAVDELQMQVPEFSELVMVRYE
ncbi:MAG: cell division protein FtsL [Pseudohongiellaceae bacterium]|nr:cell division protein FtsL [Pseudohongiellaceae bacterium]